MSVSSLPEWKQLLLERKRREEEERDRREKEEEEKFANMPAWKRGIIQRRKAKQETLGDRERDRDVCLLQVDVRSPSDGLSDTDSSVTVNLGSEPSLSPDPGLWLDEDPRLVSQVSLETIVPVHENPFILTQSVWRKGRDVEGGNEPELKDKEQDKVSPRAQDGEPTRGRDIEMKIERFRDLSEGREKERSRDRSQGREHSRERREKDKSQRKESLKDAVKDQEFIRVRKDTEEKDNQQQNALYSPLGPCLRTIRADNIIIIEQERKSSDERRGRWREAEKEREKMEEEHQGKRGMKMDLREILAGGGSVTEIRASEVLIIKPSVSPEDMNAGGKGREEGEMKFSGDVRRESAGREVRTDLSWLKEKEKEKPWGQATVINKDERKDSLDDSVFIERGGRVSQLLSKFGQHPKPPSRSKSSDNFLPPGGYKYLLDQDELEYEEMKADGKSSLLKCVPKRSFSFSDRVISAKENGVDDEGPCERRMRERVHSDKSVTPWEDLTPLKKETKIKLGCARLLDKDRFGNYKDVKTENETRRGEAETCSQHRNEAKKVDPVDKRAAEKAVDADGDKGFTVASVKNTEGISFARRVPIRQDVRARAERETKHLPSEKNMEKAQSAEKAEAQLCDATEREPESSVLAERSYLTTTSTESVSACPAAESHCSHESGFTESSSLLSTVTERAPQKRPDWGSTASRGAYLAHCVLSQHTEELISKIEKIGDTTVYNSDRLYRTTQEIPKQEGQSGSENLVHDVTPRSPKKMAPTGTSPGTREIQIPRTVFYVADEMLDRNKTNERQNWEGGQGVERRDSWRIGKPLSRIESLREKIRQRELEKRRQRDSEEGDGSEAAADVGGAQTDVDRYEVEGTEKEKAWEAACGPAETEEDAASQTSAAAFDVIQEVASLKTCSQLPVSVPHAQAARGEEATCDTAASEVISDGLDGSEDEDDPLKHVEEELRRHRGRHRNSKDEEEEDDEGKGPLEDEEVEEYASPLDPAQTTSPSPPHPNSLAAMSRIYNLETVGSRSGLCLRERAVDISSSVQLVKVKPLVSNSQQGDSLSFIGGGGGSNDVCGVQTIQRQIEQFQLKEQEALKSCTSPKKEAKGQQSSRGIIKQQVKDDAKTQEKDVETPELNSKVSPQRVCSPTSHLKQTATTTHSFLRSQSPDNSLKSTDCAPTPAPSPSSPSPAPSPSISPSSTPSPTLFSIRSASGGPAKRGATMTITPKKTAAATGSSTRSVTAGPVSAKTSSQQTQTTPAAAESGKKKYPTAEEIEVIGGYQNLEKSCLVKKGGTPKRGKVCFDEDQLEQVCEYPSETFMLAFGPNELLRMERLQGDEAQEDDAEAEGGNVVFKGTKSVGIATTPRLRVGQCHPLLKRHKV
ncbi:unnamed protein product [Ophioblennius macclurei]